MQESWLEIIIVEVGERVGAGEGEGVEIMEIEVLLALVVHSGRVIWMQTMIMAAEVGEGV